eukprot:scaffold167573_cov27-Tisochrysis_lutea.AAC.1
MQYVWLDCVTLHTFLFAEQQYMATRRKTSCTSRRGADLRGFTIVALTCDVVYENQYRHHSSRPRPLQAYNGYTDQGICGPDFSCINCFLGQTTGINKGAPCASSSINCCLKNGIWGKQVGALPGKNL